MTDPSHTRLYFRKSHQHIKAADNNSGWLFGEVLGSCVGLVSGARWHALRSELEPSFTQSAAAAHMTSIVENARAFISSELLQQTLINQKNDHVVPINPSRDLQFYPFFVVAGMLFGDPLSPQQKASLRDLAPLREELFREVIRGGVNRWGTLARLFQSNGTKLLGKFHMQWLRFVEEAYERGKQAEDSKRNDSARQLPVVKLWEAVKEGRISEREVHRRSCFIIHG